MSVVTTKKNIRTLSPDELKSVFAEWGEKNFRVQQTLDWIWKKGARSFDEMSNLSAALRDKLKETFDFPSLQIDVTQKSSDGTIKVRFKTYDNFFVEGVLIPAPEIERLTACVSSQVGCSLTCAFCATGKLKRERNLNFDEIFDQVTVINKLSEEHFGRRLTNIVFMGMGEPLLNYAQVNQAIERITSPDALHMSPRRITVSTAGIAKMMRKLGEDNVKYRLALSLHAPNDLKRSKIMPINEQNNLAALVDAMEFYYSRTKNRISFEYILFDNFNDSIEDAKQLVKLARRIPSKVNIIEYNPVDGTGFSKASEQRLNAFIQYLSDNHITATVRRSRGKDIDAACGQLANKG
jgi:23S rRNA (adenine2503-C2)-methyltransferase